MFTTYRGACTQYWNAKGEILSLQWHQVDLAMRSIHIQNGKNKRGDPRIPMNDAVLAQMLKLHDERQGVLVFPSPLKNDKRMLDLKRAFKSAIRLSGIPKIRFHDLRHTFATRLVQRRVDLITVQHLLCHAKITMTARYAHPLADEKMLAVKRLERGSLAVVPAPNQPPDRLVNELEQAIS